MNLRWVIFAAVLTAVISSQVARLFLSFNPVSELLPGEGELLPALLLREASYLVLALLSVLFAIRSRRYIFPSLLLAAYLIACLLKMTLNGSNLGDSVYGLRVVVVIFCFPALYALCLWDNERWKRILVASIKISIVALIPITIYQVRFFPENWGVTFLGSRASGMYPNPILYSMVLGSFALFLYVAKASGVRFWVALCIGLATATGGRSGILACVVVLLATFVPPYAQRRRLIKPVFAVAGVLVFLLISNPLVTGRETTAESGLRDGRIALWTAIVDRSISEGMDSVLMGTNIGDGTNAISRNNADMQGENVSDSTYVMLFRSFGLIGVLFFLAFLLLIYAKTSFDGFIAIAVFFIFSMAQSLPEIHPVGILVALSLALCLARTKAADELQRMNRNQGYELHAAS